MRRETFEEKKGNIIDIGSSFSSTLHFFSSVTASERRLWATRRVPHGHGHCRRAPYRTPWKQRNRWVLTAPHANVETKKTGAPQKMDELLFPLPFSPFGFRNCSSLLTRVTLWILLFLNLKLFYISVYTSQPSVCFWYKHHQWMSNKR